MHIAKEFLAKVYHVLDNRKRFAHACGDGQELTVMDSISDETRKVRRTIRDLAALSAVPAMWVGYDRQRLAESVGEVLLKPLRLNFVFVRLRDQEGGVEREVIRAVGADNGDVALEKIRAALNDYLLQHFGEVPAPGKPVSVYRSVRPAGPRGRFDARRATDRTGRYAAK